MWLCNSDLISNFYFKENGSHSLSYILKWAFYFECIQKCDSLLLFTPNMEASVKYWQSNTQPKCSADWAIVFESEYKKIPQPLKNKSRLSSSFTLVVYIARLLGNLKTLEPRSLMTLTVCLYGRNSNSVYFRSNFIFATWAFYLE